MPQELEQLLMEKSGPQNTNPPSNIIEALLRLLNPVKEVRGNIHLPNESGMIDPRIPTGPVGLANQLQKALGPKTKIKVEGY